MLFAEVLSTNGQVESFSSLISSNNIGRGRRRWDFSLNDQADIGFIVWFWPGNVVLIPCMKARPQDSHLLTDKLIYFCVGNCNYFFVCFSFRKRGLIKHKKE